jgi:hypothetical protein
MYISDAGKSYMGDVFGEIDRLDQPSFGKRSGKSGSSNEIGSHDSSLSYDKYDNVPTYSPTSTTSRPTTASSTVAVLPVKAVSPTKINIAVITPIIAKIGKLYAVIKAMVVIGAINFAGLIALILGITLPLYAKFKKAGIVLPISTGYEQAAVHPTYYNSRAQKSTGSFAPIPSNTVDTMSHRVLSLVDGAVKMFKNIPH